MLFHQRLEGGAHIRLSGIVLQTEIMQRLALGVADHAAFRLRRLGARPPAPTGLLEHVEGIIRAVEAGVARPPLHRLVDRAVHADFPGRPMTVDRILLITRDRVVAHAGEEIVRLVILAHMREAEVPVFLFPLPALRRAMRGPGLASLPVAGRTIDALALLRIGLDPDAIEMG